MSNQYPPYQPGPGDHLPSGAPNPYGPVTPGTQPNVSAIVLTVIAGLGTMTCYCAPVTLAPLVLGILGIVKQGTDPAGAARLTKIGWVVLAVLSVLAAIAAAGIAVWAMQQDSTSYSPYDTY